MLTVLARLIFFVSGWKLDPASPRHIRRAVMIAAPHTSNWDIVYARAAFELLGLPVRFAIKKEWMRRFPVGLLLKFLGAIPIDRTPRKEKKISMVQAMVNLFEEHDELIVLVPPEGTRQYVEQWKTGFYHVALGAGVPILLGYLDYQNKQAGVMTTVIEPSGDIEQDISYIKSLYRTVQAKYPERGIR